MTPRLRPASCSGLCTDCRLTSVDAVRVSVDRSAELAAAARCGRRRGRLVLVAVAAALIGVAGCGGHSAASEDSVARSVPVPSGVTFASINDQTNPQLVGPVTHEANAVYTYPPMPCSQLLAEWRSAFQAAHWAIDEKASTSGVIELKHHGYVILVNVGGITTCDQSIVSVR